MAGHATTFPLARSVQHWKQMPAGSLTRRACEWYLEERPLSRDRIGLICAYFRSWMTQYPGAQYADLMASIDEIKTRDDIDDWLHRAGTYGIDPL